MMFGMDFFAQSSFRTIRNAVPHTSSMDDAGVKYRVGWSTWLVDHLLGFGWIPFVRVPPQMMTHVIQTSAFKGTSKGPTGLLVLRRITSDGG